MSKLEKLLPRCKTKDTHDFPDLKDGERCSSCELWEAIDQYADEARIDELKRTRQKALSSYKASKGVFSGYFDRKRFTKLVSKRLAELEALRKEKL